MSGVATPPEITEPFGKNADAGTITLPIPLTSATPGVASFDKGFPARTMQPIAAGGIPPFGPDANGILYMISAHTAYAQAGQPYLWSATVAAAIGGYAVGTILGMADGTGAWLNTTNGNMTNPDGGSSAGWVAFASYGRTDIFVASAVAGVINLTPAQQRRGIIRLIGNLTSNVLVVFQPVISEYLIVNATTGAFTLSVAATTQSGAPTVIPQTGVLVPTPVYSDGVNVYPAVPPPNVTGDINADPNTLVQRDNTGQIFATRFWSNNGYTNNAIASVFYDTGDGYLQKIAISNLEAQLLLSALNGQVSNGQVPRSAVTQFISGVTATAGEIAIPLPSGLNIHLKWGQLGPVSDPGNTTVDVGVAFPTAFPNQCVFGICTSNRNVAANGQAANGSGFTSNRTVNGMTCTIDSVGGGVASGTWFAIGF